jgi:hypothetical protein
MASGMPYFSTPRWIEMDLDAADLLAPVNAALEAAWRRAAGAAVDHHGAGFWGVTAGYAPGSAQVVEQSAPQPEPSPAGKEREQRAEWDARKLPDGTPLQAAEAHTPDRHHRLAQAAPASAGFGPHASCRPRAVRRHRGKFAQHVVHEGIDVTEGIPGRWRGLCRTDSGTDI